MNDWKILDVRWFGVIGIVRVDTGSGICYYIGRGQGAHEETDKQFISDWGMSFPNDAGDVLFGINKIPCLMYDGNTFYGDQKSLDFIKRMIQNAESNSVRKSARID